MTDTFYSFDSKQDQSSVGSILVPLGCVTREDGTAVTIFSSGSNVFPGFSQESNKEVVLRWNNVATPTAAAFSFATPVDLDDTKDLTIHWVAAMSGSTDTPEITHEVYFGAGDTDAAGTDDEIDGGTEVTEYTSTVASADIPSHPSFITVIFVPKAGEVGTDDTLFYAVWIEYTTKSGETQINGTSRLVCRVLVPYVHTLVSAQMITENLSITGTVTVTLNNTDPGQSRGGAIMSTALNNTTLLPPNTNTHTTLDFVLKDADKAIAPANRVYFLTINASDPADRVSEAQLILKVDPV